MSQYFIIEITNNDGSPDHTWDYHQGPFESLKAARKHVKRDAKGDVKSSDFDGDNDSWWCKSLIVKVVQSVKPHAKERKSGEGYKVKLKTI